MSSKEDYIIYGLKLFYSCLCTIFIFFKITNSKITNKKNIGIILLVLNIIVILCTVFVFRALFVNILLYMSMCGAIYIVMKNNIGYIMISIIIAFASYYIFFAISVSLTFLIMKILDIKNKFFIFFIIIFLHQIFINLFFKIRRFKNRISIFK